MASINTAILAGNIGQDPEPMGEGGARFSLATAWRRRVGDNDYEDVTDWHKIVVWGNTAKFILDFAKKGMHVTVQGAISYYRDEEKGVTYTSIRATNIVLPKQATATTAKKPAKDREPFTPAGEDDIPWE